MIRKIGIFGLDVNVVIQRPGYRVAKRRIMRQKVPREHRMTREEAMNFMRERFSLEVVE